MKEELFGPIMPIITYTEIEKAIEFINNTKYLVREKPLGLYVFTSNSSTAKNVLEQTQSGGACVNDTMLQYNCPATFGGIGQSGIGGGVHGKQTFENFVHKKTVLDNSTLLDPPIRYPPYTPSKVTQMLFLQRTSINFKKIGIIVLLILLPALFFKFFNISITKKN